MAKTIAPSPEELDLRRRARRRLVGAVALALLAVVVLPMVFDQAPKPLGPDVDIRIPDTDTPFVPVLPAAPAPGEQSPPAPLPPAPAAQQPRGPEQPGAEPKPAPPAKPKQAAAERPPEPEEKRAEPASEGFAAQGYFLQLGAFTNESNARQLADKARAAGFAVKVQSIGGQVRVRVGPYTERRDALEMQAKLRAKGFGPVLLGP